MAANKEFEFCGVNHLALVCKDMAKTVEFYRDILGMPLTKTIDLPGGRGQHFFFDIGNGDSLAFFWFPEAPEAVPGISAPAALPTQGLPDHDHVLIGRAGGVERDFHLMAEELAKALERAREGRGDPSGGRRPRKGNRGGGRK